MSQAAPDNLIGRATEVAALVARVRDAASGRPGLVHLVGSLPGIGKSSLLALLRQALGDEATMLVTACAEGGADYDGMRGLFGPGADHLLTTAPDAGTIPRALQCLVGDLATTRPLVVVLDDAQHCDPATARWLGLLARRAAGQPVCVVLAYPFTARAVIESLFAELTGVLDTSQLELGPLSEADMREHVRRCFGVAPHEDFLRVWGEVCAGHPQIVSRWFPRLREEGRLPDAATAALLRAEATVEATALTMAWLAEETDLLRYATAVAVIGSAEPRSVASLCGLPPHVVEPARAMLGHARILDEDGRYRTHALRDAVLGLCTPEELDDLRYRGAQMMWDEGRSCPEIADVIVPIRELSDMCMIVTLRRAAEESPADVAATYLRRAMLAAPACVETRLELANVLTDTDCHAACDMYAEALPHVEDEELLDAALLRYGLAAMRANRSREGFEVLSGLLPQVTDRVPVEATLLTLGLIDRSTAVRAVELARDISPPASLSAPGRRLVGQLARADAHAGERADRALELARSAVPSGACSYSDLFTGQVLHHCGASEEAVAVLNRVPDPGGAAMATRALVRIDCGELVDAVVDAEKAILIADHPRNRAVLAYALVCRGEDDRAEPLLVGLDGQDPLERGVALVARARWLRNRGDREAALTELLHCGREFDDWGVRNPVFVPWWLDAVTLLVELGRSAEALVDRFRSPTWDTARARGYALLAAGLTTGEIDVLERAVTELSAAGARLQQVQALLALGTGLLRRGDDQTARTHFRAAVDLAVRCGDTAAAEAARDALTLAGGRMSAVSATPLQTLTGGQRRVAELVAQGLTNREIAEALFVTVRAVESHLSNAYRKLGVRTRAELAVQVASAAG